MPEADLSRHHTRSPTPHAPTSLPECWDKYKPHKGDGEQPAPPCDTFGWMPQPGHGPGAGLLGPCNTALELGPGEGAEAAYLAHRGVEVVRWCTGRGGETAETLSERRHRGERTQLAERGVKITAEHVADVLSKGIATPTRAL
ncbi:hypothetical protein OIE63_23985 [Streptomyces sp. NBC_01795]|uniref:hypothetical protein n=1 Tax=Streptomyces sp. NBC_01795 TaxID=2975943 RepID=UPI002DDB6934|nr:hypothetical protein [Streptomyces sp. NBC_01795]WSA94292.1 hypothetical protein OIE63_23985 [Streptomyces sp. NBC_01795]